MATQKPARVAPRNIQFKDNVDIRQIPRNDEGGQGFDGQSWDPNLHNKGVFNDKPKKQKKVVIAIVAAGITVLAIVIAVVVGVVVSQKSSTASDNSLSYNQACSPGSNQCISSKGLYCPNGFCVCSSSTTWNPTNSTCAYLKYNNSCTSSSQCDSSLQLVCTNGLCKCNGYYTYNATNSACALILNNTLTYGDACVSGSSQCKSSVGLTCSTGNCTCTVTKAWNVSACSCPSGTFLNSSSLCETQRKYNASCVVGSMQCDSNRGLSCNNSQCVCDTTNYWNSNFEQCYARLNYSEACSYDSDCIPTLSCPTVAGVCNCSRYLSDYTCNCANTQYFDPALNQCVSRASYGGSCTASLNYTCLLSLQCPSGTCNCPTGTSWNATATVCK